MKKIDSLETLKRIVSKRINTLRESLRIMQMDAEAGENVDDTILRGKLSKTEAFYYKHFGRAF